MLSWRPAGRLGWWRHRAHGHMTASACLHACMSQSWLLVFQPACRTTSVRASRVPAHAHCHAPCPSLSCTAGPSAHRRGRRRGRRHFAEQQVEAAQGGKCSLQPAQTPPRTHCRAACRLPLPLTSSCLATSLAFSRARMPFSGGASSSAIDCTVARWGPATTWTRRRLELGPAGAAQEAMLRCSVRCCAPLHARHAQWTAPLCLGAWWAWLGSRRLGRGRRQSSKVA